MTRTPFRHWLLAAVVFLPAITAHAYEVRGKLFLPPRYSRGIMWVRVRLCRVEPSFFAQVQFALYEGHPFHFRGIDPGSYVLSTYVNGYGFYWQEVTVGPEQSNARGQVEVEMRLDLIPSRPLGALEQRSTVSVPQAAATQQYLQAKLAFVNHEQDRGIRLLERAVAQFPDFPDALNALGEAYRSQGDWPQAERCFRESLERQPRQFEAPMSLGAVLLEEHRQKDALTYGEMAVLRRPDNPQALTQLGRCYLALERYHDAMAALREAARIAPDGEAHPQLGLAEVYAGLGDRRHEAEELRDFLRRFPNDPAAERARQRVAELARE